MESPIWLQKLFDFLLTDTVRSDIGFQLLCVCVTSVNKIATEQVFGKSLIIKVRATWIWNECQLNLQTQVWADHYDIISSKIGKIVDNLLKTIEDNN